MAAIFDVFLLLGPLELGRDGKKIDEKILRDKDLSNLVLALFCRQFCQGGGLSMEPTTAARADRCRYISKGAPLVSADRPR